MRECVRERERERERWIGNDKTMSIMSCRTRKRERKGEVRSRWYCGANGSHWGERDNLECILLDSYNWGSFNGNLRLVVFVNFISHCSLINMCCFNYIFDSGSCARNRFYTHTHPPLKTDEKCRQKVELGFAECNFQNSDKKYSAYGVCTQRLVLPSKKSQNEFYPKYAFF